MKFILPIIVLGMCVATYFLYISGTADEVRALSMKKASYDVVLQTAKDVVALRDDVLAESNNISEANINKLNKIVPAIFNSVLFANDINSMASKNNLIVKDFRVNPQVTQDRILMISEQAPTPYKTTVIAFRMVGQYSSFVKFLTDLESNLRLVDVVGLSIRAMGGANSTDNSLEYLLEMNTYSLR
jgi:Tfp pilus assembly protein PilO